jgi:hypothetical protein
MGMTTTLGWRDHIQIRQLNSLAQLGDSTSTMKLLPLGDGGCRMCAKKMGDSMFTMTVSPLGQWGVPLGQQNWGIQRPQQNYCRRAMGDAACAPKLGDSTSTIKVLPLG